MAGVAYDLLGAAEPLMKRYYSDRRVYSMAYRRRPLLGMISKKTGVVGGSPLGNAKGGYQVPLTLDDIAGESARFPQAALARDGNSHIVWDMNRVKRYATYTIDGETVDAMTSVGAFMDASRPLMNSAINQVSNSLAYMAYHDATGMRGKISGKATNVLTLDAATSYLARTLSLKRMLVSSTDLSGSAAPDGESTGSKITAINLNPGGQATVTVADGTNFTIGDYIFALGDYTGSGDAASVCMDGLGSWGPVPSGITGASPDFKGVDRSVWKEKLLMLHQTIALQTAANHGDGKFVRGIREALALLDANEGAPDALFVDPIRWAQIESDLATQARYEMMYANDEMKAAKVGFKTISFESAGVQVYKDPFCPPNTGYALQLNTWEMFSIRRIPGPVSRDGNMYRRLEGQDEVEARIGGYGNIACNAPGHNMVLNFALS